MIKAVPVLRRTDAAKRAFEQIRAEVERNGVMHTTQEAMFKLRVAVGPRVVNKRFALCGLKSYWHPKLKRWVIYSLGRIEALVAAGKVEKILCPECKGERTVQGKAYANQFTVVRSLPCFHCNGEGFDLKWPEKEVTNDADLQGE